MSWDKAVALFGLALLVSMDCSSTIQRSLDRSVFAAQSLKPLESFRATDRVVVIAPHPDDETLCCAGIIQQARARGAQVSVVWITNGDGSKYAAWLEASKRPTPGDYRRLGEEREFEARVSATSLGIDSSAQIFLGFPDASLGCLLADVAKPARCTSRTRASAVPYETAWQPNAPYSRLGVESTLDAVLRTLQPTVLVAPCTNDLHPDHAAIGRLMRKIVQSPESTLLCWIVHGEPTWPAPPRYSPESPLSPPSTSGKLEWRTVPLTDAERANKLSALLHYKTQRRTMENFLLSFVRSNELVAIESR